MTITQSKQRISDFQSHVNSHAQAIRDAGNQAWQRVTAKGEVEIVREFLAGKEQGTDYLNDSITTLLSSGGRVVKFASIFLHQMPMVFGLRNHLPSAPTKLAKRCELGDLQTVFLYLDRDKNICQIRSVIFQAKLKPHSGSHVINHPQQRELYDECAGFEYNTVLAGQTRRLPDGHLRERALQYIFVNERPVRVRTIPSNTGQGAFENYGEHFLRFLNDSTGLDVPPTPTTNDAWGQVVWDMITHVANEVTSRGLIRNSGLKGLLDHFNHFENHDTFSIDTTGGKRLRDGEGGFGLQLVIVWDSELGGEQSTRVTVKPDIGVEQIAEENSPSSKQDLQSANINDLLVNLQTGSKEEQHDIIIELRRRSGYRAIMANDAKKILNILNYIHQDLTPETMSAIYKLQQNLRSITTVHEVKIYQ